MWVRLGIQTRDRIDLTQDIALLVSQYLHARPDPTVARTFDEQVLGIGRGKERDEDVEEVERAILGQLIHTNLLGLRADLA